MKGMKELLELEEKFKKELKEKFSFYHKLILDYLETNEEYLKTNDRWRKLNPIDAIYCHEKMDQKLYELGKKFYSDKELYEIFLKPYLPERILNRDYEDFLKNISICMNVFYVNLFNFLKRKISEEELERILMNVVEKFFEEKISQ